MKYCNCYKDLNEIFLANCNDFVFVLDPKFKITGLSPVAEKFFGVKNQNIFGQELFVLAERKKVVLSFTADDLRVCNKTKKHDFIKGYIYKGRRKQIQILWKYLFVTDKKHAGYFLIIGKDLPGFIMAKGCNFLSDEYLKSVIDNLPEYIYWKDLDLVYRGCNKRVSDYLNLPSPASMIGKTDKDFGWSKDRIKILNDIDKQIIRTGVPNIIEDVIPLPDKSERIMLSSKTPLRDQNDQVIGIVGISVDITDQKKIEKLQIEKDKLVAENKLYKKMFVEQKKLKKVAKQLESVRENNTLVSAYLNSVIENLPEYIYWKDLDLIYRGCNKRVSDSLNLPSPADIVGKTDKDFGWSEERIKFLNHIDKQIIKTGIPNISEDAIPWANGLVRIMLSSKTPLRDMDNRIIGIIGISVDATDQKKADRLQAERDRLEVENKLHQKIILEQNKFRKIANQVAHDIRSPLASLSMMIEFCKNIPNTERVSLRAVATSINDIVNNLLDKYKKDNDQVIFDDGAQGVLVSLALLEILSEKKYQYKNLKVDFDYNFEPNAVFGFMSYGLIDFKRMISNLINNSIDSFAGSHGNIELKLAIEKDNILVTVKDNGKGMPKKVAHDIMNNVVVTSNKPKGNGLGLTQVRDMLAKHKGKIVVDSKLGKGTVMTLIFPQVEAPKWLAKSISLVKSDLVLILDDDLSIHNVWQLRLKPYPEIKIKCFAIAKDLLDFFNRLTLGEKHNVFLLSDFDLGDQELDGLQVIRQLAQYISVQEQSILVTSHYNNQDIIDFVSKNDIRILPKQLIQYAKVEVSDMRDNHEDIKDCSDIDLVVIDDDKMFADSLTSFFQAKGMQVNTYYNPQKFLDDLIQYKKDTKIFMDNDFKSKMTGVDLAKILYEAGYAKLYMLSGSNFEQGKIPSYLTPIMKGDLESLKKIFNLT